MSVHHYRLLVVFWDYTSESAGSVLIFRLMGYMFGIVGGFEAFRYFNRLNASSGTVVGRFAALAWCGASAGVVSLYWRILL